MKVSSSVPFGPDALIEWYGPRLVDGAGNPSFNSLRKSNAITYLSSTGQAYFGGSIIAGTLVNQVINNDKGNYGQNSYPAILGPFTTNGNPRVIQLKYKRSASLVVQSETEPTVLPQPGIYYQIQRYTGSTGWVTIQTGSMLGDFHAFKDPIGGQWDWRCSEYVSGDITITDSLFTTEIITYRVLVTSHVTRLHEAGVSYQELVFSSTEAV
jgi:hypothetical protein